MGRCIYTYVYICVLPLFHTCHTHFIVVLAKLNYISEGVKKKSFVYQNRKVTQSVAASSARGEKRIEMVLYSALPTHVQLIVAWVSKLITLCFNIL